MAALIEELLFPKMKSCNHESRGKVDRNSFIQSISKNIKGSSNFIKRNFTEQGCKTYLHLCYQQQEYLIELTSSKDHQNLIINIRQIHKIAYSKVDSKQMEILLVKDFYKNKNQYKHQSLCFIENGCVTMSIRFYYQSLTQNKTNWIQFYTQIITKHFHVFHHNLKKVFLRHNTHSKQYEVSTQFEQNLHMVQNISTIQANFDISEERSQFKVAQEVTRVQRERILQAKSAIVNESQLEKINNLMVQIVKNHCTSQWILISIATAFLNLKNKGKNVITIHRSNERKIQDFLFNVIKLQVKQRNVNPYASGGSSYIHILRGLLTFVNSIDYTSYKKNQERSERFIVLKTIKPQLEQRMISKIIHEKKIVSKLKGSCSNFIPKYYGTEKNTQLSNGLLMQFLPGQQLDKYVLIRSQTISLWTKVFLLLGIVHGMRHLISYGIVHFDLKPVNIIVCRNLVTKILDYGQAYHEEHCMKEYCPGYTFPYAAPQVFARYDDHINNRPQTALQLTEKQDVFAFGMIMYELLFNGPVFEIPCEKLKKVYYQREIYDRIMLSYQKALIYGRDPIISTLLAITMRCLHSEPSFRPKFDWIGVSLKLILSFHTEHQPK